MTSDVKMILCLCQGLIRSKTMASSRILNRCTSTLQKYKNIQVSKHLSLRKVTEDRDIENVKNSTEHLLNHSVNKHPNLVLLFDWLYAKPSALDKYCDLYHNLGLDVLTIKGSVTHFLWPPIGKKLANELLTYLSDERDPESDQYIVHAFSIGAYNYTMCMMLDSEKYGFFRSNVKGQIFDSIVIGSYDNMSTGMASAFTNSRVLRKSLVNIMDLYYGLTRKTTKETYDKMVTEFKDNPIQVPSVVFYSHNDPMCDVKSMENMKEQWRPKFDVEFKSWDKSVHAAHLKFHSNEYLLTWSMLMQKLHLIEAET